MKRRNALMAMMAVLLLMAAGCVMQQVLPGGYNLKVSSDPPGVRFSVNETPGGSTPVEIAHYPVAQYQQKTVFEFRKDGYEEAELTVNWAEDNKILSRSPGVSLECKKLYGYTECDLRAVLTPNPTTLYSTVLATNTIEAFEGYLKRYPTSPFSANARVRIAELRYVEATKRNTREAYRLFLRDVDPSGPAAMYADMARGKLEQLEYGEARERNTKQAFREFVDKHPGSNLAADARDRIRLIEEDVQRRLQSATRQQQLGNEEDALKEYLMAVRMDSQNTEAWEQAVALCAGQRRCQVVRDGLRDAARRDAGNQLFYESMLRRIPPSAP